MSELPDKHIYVNIRMAQLYAKFYNLSKNCVFLICGIDIWGHVQIVQKSAGGEVFSKLPSKMERDLSTMKSV